MMMHGLTKLKKGQPLLLFNIIATFCRLVSYSRDPLSRLLTRATV